MSWAATDSGAAYPPVSRDQIETVLNSLALEDFDGVLKEIPR
jgi:hypothetical protein